VPRYFFNMLAGGERVADRQGDMYSSLEAAKTDAALIAHGLAPDVFEMNRKATEITFEITDETGRCLALVPFSLVV
jgi:hypothetical protein